MPTKSYSPSELETWVDCSLKWYYRYSRRLHPNDDIVGGPLVSGRTVHAVVEACLKEKVEWTPYMLNRALVNATDSNANLEIVNVDIPKRHIDTYKRVRKYALGVERALDKVPQWVWNEPNWHIEQDLNAMVGDVHVHGRPDLWRFVDDDLYNIIELWDIKTTEHDPMDYVLWNPQLRLYAAALAQAHDKTVVYRVLTLPTDQKKPHRTSPPLLFLEEAHQRLIGQVTRAAREIAEGTIIPREGRHCNFCDFKDVCMTRIFGFDTEGFIADNYTVKERKAR